ncbi:putative F-box protein At3g52320 [Silene latifolia]|uniref:putative F-box protein At3g52320 n=1 Tax=Silene latifolia TaxID=37657 RepID=UPI003D76BF51
MEMNIKRNPRRRVKRRKSDTSNASIPHIPDEIQIEILSWLPFKSLSRCKCVSKHWNDTLTIQAFLVKHSRSYDKHSKLAFVACSTIWSEGSIISIKINDDNARKTTDSWINGHDEYFTDLPTKNDIFMSNICNDLICLFDPNTTRASLLNIKTRDFICLPAITIKSVDPFKFWYALGFDPVNKVFKVLSIIYESTRKCAKKAAILTVGSKYWNPIDYKSLPSSVTKKLPMCSSTNNLCFDGVIYWVREKIIKAVKVLTVAAFDLNREASRQFELVRIPVSGRPFKYYLTSLKDCPTLFIWKVESHDTREVEQWTLLNHKNPMNATWKMWKFTNDNFRKMNYEIAVAGGSILVQFVGWIDPRGLCQRRQFLYSSYDLENFAIK